MAYESLYDPTNPFNREGLSREVRAILDYLEAAKRATGVDVVVTSTTDHPVYSASGNRSRHRLPGTNGEGLALDCRMRQRGDLTHRAVFDAFVPVESQLAELIYAGAPYNVKNGKRVPPYAVADHRDHVHVGVALGVFLRYPTPEPPPPPPQPMEVPEMFVCYYPANGQAFLMYANGTKRILSGQTIEQYKAKFPVVADADLLDRTPDA